MTEKVKETERKLKIVESKCDSYVKEIDKAKRDLQKSESIENELRKNLESQNKENLELRSNKDQVYLNSLIVII